LKKLAIGIACVALFWGCSGSSDDEQKTPPQSAPETVEDTLARFNIDTAQSPREDGQGSPLPDSYAPLGAATPVERFAELAFVGPRLASDSQDDVRVHVLKLVDDGAGRAERRAELYQRRVSDDPWLSTRGDTRAATSIDVDGDGRDELLFVFKQSSNPRLQFRVVDDALASFAQLDQDELFNPDQAVRDLDLAAGDFDGDGWADALLAVDFGDSVVLRVLRNDGEGALALTDDAFEFPNQQTDSSVDVRLAAGNLDHDSAWEFGLVINEDGTVYTSRYAIHDDLNHRAEELAAGVVRTQIDGIEHTALVADLALGDIDGDRLDEVVFAGIEKAGTISGSQDYLMYALDDGVAQFADIGAATATDRYPNSSGVYDLVAEVVHINTLDVDGDGADEVAVDRFVYEDWFTAAPWTDLFQVRDGGMVYDRQEQGTRWKPDTSAVVVGDINSDGREDLIFYHQSAGNRSTGTSGELRRGDIQIWGNSMVNGWSHLLRLEAVLEGGGSQNPEHPILLTPNVDDDSIAVRYSDGSYQLVFSEPIVVAALAAAPCDESLGQNLSACRTSYGEAETSSETTENRHTITAELHVGLKAGGELFGFAATSEVVGKVKEKRSGSMGRFTLAMHGSSTPRDRLKTRCCLFQCPTISIPIPS
jgi:hypothetical protein